MKRERLFLLIAMFAGASIFTACDDNDDNGGETPPMNSSCYILNQGNFGENNASLQIYDKDSGTASSALCESDIFTTANGELLGDVAQDMLWTNGKLFVTVSNSQKLEILNENGKRIAKHTYSAEGAQPRNIATDGKKVYVTNYDGYVYVYNTSSGDSITRIYSGSYPEGISCNNGYLIVNNSNQGGYGGGEASIAIIDTKSGTLIKSIKDNVCNPYGESVICNDDVYIVDSGNYDNIPSTIYRVDTDSLKVTKIGTASLLSAYENHIFYTDASFTYSTMSYNNTPLYKMDVTTGEKAELVAAEKMKDIYSLDVDPATGDVYVGYAQYGILGTMRIYDGTTGEQKATFDVGYYPTGARFKN